MNSLYYGDNLDVLPQHVADESVDLVYLDPPFNSNRSYNVLFKNRSGDDAQAQIEAFDDTWTWSQQSEAVYAELVQGGAPVKVADALEAMRRLLGDNDVLAYLVMMAARLVELHRVLKPTGSLYLHCDPTASHYLKVLLDAIFGPEHFLNEIIWKRTSAHNRVVRYGPVHDTLLFYAKGDQWHWTPQHVPYDPDYLEQNYRRIEEGTGRRFATADLTSERPGSRYLWKGMPPPGHRYWGVSEDTMARLEREGKIYYTRNGLPRLKQYLDEMLGQLLQDVWTDLRPIHPNSKERLGYPTQKPLVLLERIVGASCPPNGTVLDPFCGCGTTVDAAQKLGRRWIGIDITYLAIDLIGKRLRHTYGDAIAGSYRVHGIPHDVDGAQALFDANPFDFERWAVSLVDGQPNQKQVGDKGVDGIIRFPLSHTETGRVVVSVKGGKHVNPAMLRELGGTVKSQRAQMGVLITMSKPTADMRAEANRSGTYEHPLTGTTYPRVQVVTVAELLDGKRPKMPTPILPYVKARARRPEQPQLDL